MLKWIAMELQLNRVPPALSTVTSVTSVEAIDKVDSSKLDGQDNTDASMDVDAPSQEEGKNVLPAPDVITSVDAGNTPLSSDQSVSNEESAVVPE
ncbi:hypothetical protein ZWY2020_035616 [Hordeum vulgare]|nr:hypothetical protein ZWY2020_035616 [Hordeum vulgare]